ncbi:MAG: internal scaffolding protein [Microvirus sp.]|nr:MAG: internal scaffolding protein [Microvirus sp.]
MSKVKATNESDPQVFLDFYKTSGERDDVNYMAPSMTRQEFAEECDINSIMARYEAGGAVSHVNRAEPTFLDTTLYPGLQASMDAYREAAVSFAALPAKVRREFDNDPQKFVDFAVDSGNLEKMREWGLAPPPPVEPAPVQVVVTGGRLDAAVGGTPTAKP